MFEIPDDLDAALVPLAFLLGTWRGDGVGGYPTTRDFRYAQELSIRAVPGKRVLAHASRTWSPEDGRLLASEVGWWRPGEGIAEAELLLAHTGGVVEVYVGEVSGTRVELRADVVARTATAKEVTAGHRLYGLVEGDLAYAVDMAAVGQPLQPHLSARLCRVDPG